MLTPFVFRYLPKNRPITLAIESPRTIPKFLGKLKSIDEIQEQERCRCARFGTVAPPPGERVPAIKHVSCYVI
jgi:hypothetical protein